MRLYSLVIIIVLLPLLTPIESAAEVRDFSRDSMREISVEHSGSAFVLVFWSIECPPCITELAMLSKIKSDRNLPLVLVSVDSEYTYSGLNEFLSKQGLHDVESWRFSQQSRAAIYYSVSPDWQGELPRSELITSTGKRTAHIGRLSRLELVRWLQVQD